MRMARWMRFALVLALVLGCNDDDEGVIVGGAGCGGSPTPVDDDSADDDDDSTGDDDDDSTGDDDDSADDDDDDSTGDDDDDDDTTAPPVDCENLPDGPFAFNVIYGPRATEDLAFDDQGNLIGADNGNLFKSPYADTPQLWVPGSGHFLAGLRAVPSGDIVYSDVSDGTLYKVSPDGVRSPLLSGMNYGNGLEVDLDGYVYVAEQSGGRVRKVDSVTGDFEVVAQGMNNPNGIAFSPDYRTLYIGSFGGGTIHALEFDEHGNPGDLTVFASDVGNGQLDGMAVDACGNVYVCEYIAAKVWRFTPDGDGHPIILLGSETTWIPNMQWGSGIGGWDPLSLYVLDISASKLYEVPIGVPDKPRGYP